MLLHQLRYAITCAIAGRNSDFRKNDVISRKVSERPKPLPLVSLANVGVRRNGRWLVRGVDFSVSRGEIVTLIGPNGSGKSTTAKTAIGVLKPDEGRVDRACRPQGRLCAAEAGDRLDAAAHRSPADDADRAACRRGHRWPRSTATGVPHLLGCRGAASVRRRVPAGADGARHRPQARSAGARRTGSGRRFLRRDCALRSDQVDPQHAPAAVSC